MAPLLHINLVVIKATTLLLQINFMVIEATVERSKLLFLKPFGFQACLYLPKENWR
jgi:hypothetical protein